MDDIRDILEFVSSYIEEKTHYVKSQSGKMVPVYGTAARVMDAYAKKYDREAKDKLNNEDYSDAIYSKYKSGKVTGDILDMKKAAATNKEFSKDKKEFAKKGKIIQFLKSGNMNYKEDLADRDRMVAKNIKRTYIPKATKESTMFNIYECCEGGYITEDEKNILLSLLDEE